MKFPSLRRRFCPAPKAAAPEATPEPPHPLSEPSPEPSPEPGPENTSAGPDEEHARWEPAHQATYRQANRPHDFPIDLVVIHVTDLSHDKAVDRFRHAATGTGAHYLVSKDGMVTQLVREKDYTLHSGSVIINQRSIAVEHESCDDGNPGFTAAMYKSSATLVRNICLRHGIPLDRHHIIGHNEVPDTQQTDPGVYWDWTRYVALITQDNAIIVDNGNPARFWAGGGWRTSTWNPLRYSDDYRLAPPIDRDDAAWFRIPFPQAGIYNTYVWYPSNMDYCSSTPIILLTADGPYLVRIDQRTGGGRWMPLGAFPFHEGDYWVAAVSRRTTGQGDVVADAFKFVPRGV